MVTGMRWVVELYNKWANENETTAREIISGLREVSSDVQRRQAKRARFLLQEARAFRKRGAELTRVYQLQEAAE